MNSIMREDWIEVELGEVCDIISGKNQKDVLTIDGIYPIYGSGGIFGRAHSYLCEAGTTIIGRKGTINSPIYVNEKFWNVDTAFGISPLFPMDNKNVFYFCLGFNFKKLDRSTTIPSLAKTDIAKITFPLAPLPIQRAIVSKIEALFSDLDNGIANFKKAQEQLKIYRQAVLKKAFEGGFTNEVLVDGELPNEWKWQRLGDVVKTIDGDRGKNYPKKNEFSETGYCLFLSTKNVRQGYFVFDENIFISKEKDEILRGGKVQLNDVVITTRGTLGNVALFNEKTKYKNIRINSGMLILRIKGNDILQPEYLMKFITSTLFFNQLKSMQTGTAQPQIPANILREIKIAFPKKFSEQTKIVQEIESRLSVCDKMEQSINESIEKAEALRQSILKKAFEGKLLSEAEIAQCKQAADYEPASELLKKIQAEKLAKEQEKKKKPKTKK